MKSNFLISSLILLLAQCSNDKEFIMTVNGPISPSSIGLTLTHEHILVDFIGADKISEQRWDKGKVIERMMPYLKQVKDLGCRTFVDCTPEFLGRDPYLLKVLSDFSGLNIITNTGYYGAANNKYLPQNAYTESADQLAYRWSREYFDGIEESLAKPGFIKIGVFGDSLSNLHKKLVMAAARTHLLTGMTIASHTGPAKLAFQQIEILKSEGVSPEAFIWVHAQSEKDFSNHIKAAQMGAWVSFDGLNEKNPEDYLSMLKNMKKNKLLNKVLLSHDAGWYHPGEENGGEIRGYTTLIEILVPLLEKENFSKKEIYQLLVSNPAKAFTIRIRKI